MTKEEIKSEAEKIVKSVLGKSNSDATSIVVKAVSRGYDQKKLRDRLLDEGFDSKKAGKLASKVVDDLISAKQHSGGKRPKKKFEEFPEQSTKSTENGNGAAATAGVKSENGNEAKSRSSEAELGPPAEKKLKTEGDDVKPITTIEAAPVINVDQLKVKTVMAQAQKAIEEAKKRLKLPPVPAVATGGSQTASAAVPAAMPTLAPNEAEQFMAAAMEKAKRRAELSANIANRFSGAISGQSDSGPAVKAKSIVLDTETGKLRPVDSTTGQALDTTTRQPTLMANQQRPASAAATGSPSGSGPLSQASAFAGRIASALERAGVSASPAAVNADKQPIFMLDKQQSNRTSSSLNKHSTSAAAADSDAGNQYVDPRIVQKGAVRPRRTFKFHEKGEFEQLANRQRAKAKLDKLQSEISEASKKTGISSAVKLAMIAPKAEAKESEVPTIEWWDAVLFPPDDQTYDSIKAGDDADIDLPSVSTSSDMITNLIEHPIQLRPPTEPVTPHYIKVYLTKEEKKKLRRQTRRDAQREEQEKIRLGLQPPPEPKVKISNLMRVLGGDTVQDPTKMEAHVREQMAKRIRKHEEANAARKLTKEEKSAKKARKIAEDVSLGVHVTVYRVTDLSSQSNRFKVEMNAKQLQMTGLVILHKDVNIIVVEGGPKQQKFFKNLMLRRIKWNKNKEESTSTDGSGSGSGSCSAGYCDIVWEGLVKNRNFGEIRFKSCPLEKQARDLFAKHKVPHYWDMAFTRSILYQESDHQVL